MITPATGPVLCEGTVIHRGRTIATAEARLTRESDARLLAHATTTCLILTP
jgi:acyl-coenzyme A thioesterase PaaI-like protein